MPSDAARGAALLASGAAGAASHAAELERAAAALADLEATVTSLPERVTRPVLAPVSGVAFAEAKLVHTNELLVHLGSGYYAERSAVETAEILARRRALLEDAARRAREEEGEARAALSAAASSAADAGGPGVTVTPDGLVEIREEWPDEPEERALEGGRAASTTGPPPPPPPGGAERERDAEDRRILRRLAELELDEAVEEEAAAEAAPSPPKVRSPADLLTYERWKSTHPDEAAAVVAQTSGSKTDPPESAQPPQAATAKRSVAFASDVVDRAPPAAQPTSAAGPVVERSSPFSATVVERDPVAPPVAPGQQQASASKLQRFRARKAAQTGQR